MKQQKKIARKHKKLIRLNVRCYITEEKNAEEGNKSAMCRNQCMLRKPIKRDTMQPEN